ncbi:hypothetical protein VPH219E481_0077 [Vibrio phage 219E48-1]|nr:hypothetical protein PODOV021v1_p0064 [Vibrio phage 219E41.2]QZI91070.1 hypothetical protein PODOV032v1_p0065 [Vibrio phage 219E41.1]
MIKSGKELYLEAVKVRLVSDEGLWENFNTTYQGKWEELAKAATSLTLQPPGDFILADEGEELHLSDFVILDQWVPGCPVYSRVTGSLHGYYIGKTQCGGCCIDAGDGGIDVEPFDLVTTNEVDAKAIREARDLEQWEITIKNSNVTVLAQYLVSKNVTNPM